MARKQDWSTRRDPEREREEIMTALNEHFEAHEWTTDDILGLLLDAIPVRSLRKILADLKQAQPEEEA